VQAQKLFNDQEQKEHAGQVEHGQVLPVLPQTYGAQGNKGVIQFKSKKAKTKKAGGRNRSLLYFCFLHFAFSDTGQ